MTRIHIGCDRAKDRLDVLDPRLGPATAHANSAGGIGALVRA